MKKFLFLIPAFLYLSFTACNTEQSPAPANQDKEPDVIDTRDLVHFEIVPDKPELEFKAGTYIYRDGALVYKSDKTLSGLFQDSTRFELEPGDDINLTFQVKSDFGSYHWIEMQISINGEKAKWQGRNCNGTAPFGILYTVPE